MRILIDMDGVVADFHRAALRAHGIATDTVVSRWGIASVLGMDEDEFWSLMGHSFWAGIGLTREARDVVSLCRRFTKDIAFCSTPARSPESASGKLEWIQKNFPEMSRRYILTPQKQLLATPKTVLIDDKPSTIKLFHRAGGHGFLFPRPWNRDRDVEDEALWRLGAFLEVKAKEIIGGR